MKKTNKIRLLVLAISLALLISGIIGVTASAQNDASEPVAANADASLTVYKKNVSFQNAPQLVFAVAYENLDPATVTLDVWYGEQSGEAKNVTSFGNVTIDGKVYPAFAVDPADPKDLDKLVYVQAKSGDMVSEVERYSILEFAWTGVMTSATDEEAADYYSIIDYSKSVQKWLTASGKFDGTPVDNYFYVKAEGVALDASGYDSGVFTSPVTFTLGESELGWSVTTYENGEKNTETVAGGSEITVSASTVCTVLKEPEPVKPQKVEGTPIDFENVTIDSSGNGGEGTTEVVGNKLATTEKGLIEVADKNGNTTKAYYFDGDKSATENLRINSYGNEIYGKLDSANALVFNSDIKIDYAEGTTYSSSGVLLRLGSSGTTAAYAYRLEIYLDNATGTLKMVDTGATGVNAWVVTDIKPGEWFNLHVEYYKISADEMLMLLFINNELTYVSNNITKVNPNGDDAWPVHSDGYKHSAGYTVKGTDAVFITKLSGTDATIYIDNTLLRRTVLTPPTIPVDEYTSYYTPAN